VSRADERLRRTGFADALAAQISSAGQSGVVMALTGPWGSGKTSLLNLIDERLSEQPDAIVVRFNPWYFSGTEQLLQHFFSEMGGQLEEKSPKLKEVGAWLKRYGALLTPLRFVPVAGVWAEAAGNAAEAVGASLIRDEESLQKQHGELSRRLAESRQRVVIMVDDIDRLEDDEIKQVMRLVRLVGDFDNVVYLLAFDAGHVAGVLGDVGGHDEGRRYLEKIVQLSYEVPAIAPGELVDLLRDGISMTLGAASRSADQERLEQLLALLDPLVHTVRGVRRYLNVLPFAFRVVGDEIDAVDLLSLEAARLFLPATHDALPAAAATLTTVVVDYPERDEQVKRFVETGGVHAPIVKQWMDLLFPAVALSASDEDPEASPEEAWSESRRVAHPNFLRAYLEKALPETVVARNVTDQVVHELLSGNDASSLVAGLRARQVRDMLGRLAPQLLERLATEETVSREQVLALGRFLNSAEAVLGRSLGFTEFGLVAELIPEYLARRPAEDRCAAATAFIDVLSSVRVQAMAVEMLQRLGATSAGCRAELQATVRGRLLALPAETLGQMDGLAGLLDWIERREPAAAPKVVRVLEDERVFIGYLATRAHGDNRPSTLIDQLPNRTDRLERAADLHAGSDKRLRRAAAMAERLLMQEEPSSTPI
jgi:KAP-like P-loop domain-containing protein